MISMVVLFGTKNTSSSDNKYELKQASNGGVKHNIGCYKLNESFHVELSTCLPKNGTLWKETDEKRTIICDRQSSWFCRVSSENSGFLLWTDQDRRSIYLGTCNVRFVRADRPREHSPDIIHCVPVQYCTVRRRGSTNQSNSTVQYVRTFAFSGLMRCLSSIASGIRRATVQYRTTVASSQVWPSFLSQHPFIHEHDNATGNWSHSSNAELL